MKLIDGEGLKAKGIFYSKASLNRKVRDGSFPAPVYLSPQRKAWVESEIDDWLEQRAAAREARVGARTAISGRNVMSITGDANKRPKTPATNIAAMTGYARNRKCEREGVRPSERHARPQEKQCLQTPPAVTGDITTASEVPKYVRSK